MERLEVVVRDRIFETVVSVCCRTDLIMKRSKVLVTGIGVHVWGGDEAHWH